jgi:hypothetical protein
VKHGLVKGCKVVMLLVQSICHRLARGRGSHNNTNPPNDGRLLTRYTQANALLLAVGNFYNHGGAAEGQAVEQGKQKLSHGVAKKRASLRAWIFSTATIRYDTLALGVTVNASPLSACRWCLPLVLVSCVLALPAKKAKEQKEKYRCYLWGLN